jgi:hypothetical protein
VPLWWLVECALEFVVAAGIATYGNVAWWWLNRAVLGPYLLRPTDRVMEWITSAYGWLLRASLRSWPVVLGVGAALILLAAGMLWFDVLGRELTPSAPVKRSSPGTTKWKEC